MRTLARSLVVTVLLFTGGRSTHALPLDTQCDVKGAYRELDVPTGTIALSTLGETQDVELLLAPAKLESGVYDVTVTRKGENIYLADGTSTYIATQYCYEYAYSEKAILRYTALGSVGSGELIFTP